MANLKLKIGCNAQELEAAQRLRFEIFNLELKAGLPDAFKQKKDSDAFDPICEHVVILDIDKGNKVIGTYRMLLGETAKTHGGFYSEHEFDLNAVKALKGGGFLEVGRSCIYKEYRKRSVLSLLWQGIAQYAMAHRVRYIFGCSSVFTRNPSKINQYYGALKALGYFSNIIVEPSKHASTVKIDAQLKPKNPKKIFKELSPLFQGYMSLGLKVCGQPVIDEEFKTADFFVLLDIKHMNPAYKKRLFGNYLND